MIALPALALDVPPLSGRVNDLAGLLSREEEGALEAQLAVFESETSHQIVVLTVPSLEGEAIEGFALRVAEHWAIGHAGLDNGVIVVVAAKDRRARIEVGYGLEGVIPDAVAARILRERMIPRFREGAMGAGISDGVTALMAAARGEEVPPARRPRARRDGEADPLAVVMICGLMGGILGSAVAGARRRLGSGLGATLAGGAAALLLSSLVWGGVAALLGAFFGAGVFSGLASGGGYGRGHAGGGFGRGGFGGGGGGGGFGGGGGGFGGGGASGGW